MFYVKLFILAESCGQTLDFFLHLGNALESVRLSLHTQVKLKGEV